MQGNQNILILINPIHMDSNPHIKSLKLIDITDKLPILILLGCKNSLQVNPLTLDLG